MGARGITDRHSDFPELRIIGQHDIGGRAAESLLTVLLEEVLVVRRRGHDLLNLQVRFKHGKHEALADIYESIEELKYYREHFLRATA